MLLLKYKTIYNLLAKFPQRNSLLGFFKNEFLFFLTNKSMRVGRVRAYQKKQH